MKYYWMLTYSTSANRPYYEQVTQMHPFHVMGIMSLDDTHLINWKSIDVEEYNLFRKLYDIQAGIAVAPPPNFELDYEMD